jgi:hypothetical protein
MTCDGGQMARSLDPPLSRARLLGNEIRKRESVFRARQGKYGVILLEVQAFQHGAL